MLQSFNQVRTKVEIVQQIKAFEALIVEEDDGDAAQTDGQEQAQPAKKQKLTLPLCGKVISAKGNSLREACELVEAWGKSAKSTMQS